MVQFLKHETLILYLNNRLNQRLVWSFHTISFDTIITNSPADLLSPDFENRSVRNTFPHKVHKRTQLLPVSCWFDIVRNTHTLSIFHTTITTMRVFPNSYTLYALDIAKRVHLFTDLAEFRNVVNTHVYDSKHLLQFTVNFTRTDTPKRNF